MCTSLPSFFHCSFLDSLGPNTGGKIISVVEKNVLISSQFFFLLPFKFPNCLFGSLIL